MKFMKLGTRPDTFLTKEAIRMVNSDVPSDLTIQINNITCLLHKNQLVPRCGLIQELLPESEDSGSVALELHDTPGGADAFELCAKFCYGITINLSAYNIVPSICAAKYLQMTEAVEKGNFLQKLEGFFSSCILEGWKDSVFALQTTGKVQDWSDNLGIVRRCIDSIVEKILTPPSKVTWSYTYTRPGYDQKHHQSAPRDWWTEDVSELDIDLFRCIITAVRSNNVFPPQLIGEALHVYAIRWLLNSPTLQSSETSRATSKRQRILEAIASMIPPDKGSVSIGFLLRLVNAANSLGTAKAELIRRSSLQLEEATVGDLLFLGDPELVGAVLEGFLGHWRRRKHRDQNDDSLIETVGRLIDSYLQVIARDVNMPVSKMVSLAEALPEVARTDHDELYKAIDIYLKEHPDLEKEEKKRLCRMLNCQKLSSEVRAHVVRNEQLPLRTVVQVLFFGNERGTKPKSRKPPSDQERTIHGHENLISNLKISTPTSGITERAHRSSTVKSIEKSQVEQREKASRKETGGSGSVSTEKGKVVREE